ncbi:hypothetical protein [Stutzerimonas zhaodongensis]|uniref:hypothetical protein n=1 Tax=Stutzerimonas zhaodongensis TaxID=1176257 RepID=UPI002101FF14|nr:hypothetical protein [Stutzerimonas zhaodongensis]MCQ2032257.1 hypothetical protein [Stutzerimonas zhaodongensis]
MSKTYEMVRLQDADYSVWTAAQDLPKDLVFREVRELLVNFPKVDESHRYIVDIRQLPPEVVAHLQSSAKLSGLAAQDPYEPSLMEVNRTLFDAIVDLIRELVDQMLSMLTGKSRGRSAPDEPGARGRKLRIEHNGWPSFDR